MKKILIVGAGFLQSFLIKKSKELGYKTFCVDGNSKAEGFKYADDFKVIDIVDKEKCLEYARKMMIDGVVTAATDYGVLTVSYIATKMNLKGNPLDVVKVIKNKYLTRKKIYDQKIDSMSQYYEITEVEGIKDIIEKVKYPLIVKPCDGSGSRGIKRVDNNDELYQACEEALKASLSKRVLIEEFVCGKEYGIESFVSNGKIFVLAVMEKTMTEPPYYAELGHCSNSGLEVAVEKKVKDIVKNAIRSLGIISGSVNMDLLINGNEIVIIDIGVRMGGNLIGSHIVPLSTEIDYLKIILQESLGESIEVLENKNSKIVATRLLTLTPGIATEIGKIETLKSDSNIEDIILNLKVNQKINEYRTNLDGCGYVVVSDLSKKQAMLEAKLLKESIDNLIKKSEDKYV